MLRPMQNIDDTTPATGTQPQSLQYDFDAKATLEMLFGSEEDVQALFREANTWDEAFSTLVSAVRQEYDRKLQFKELAPDHNVRDEMDKIWATIGMSPSMMANLPVTAGASTTYDVNNLNDLMLLPYMVSESELRSLTDKMVKAGFLDRGQMPFGIVNASDPTFHQAWKQVLRASITNGTGISTELSNRIDERIVAAKETLKSQRPTEEANLQSVATSLLGRQLNADELSQAMNFMTSQFSYLPDEERFLDTDSPLFDETIQQQTQFEALEDVAGAELGVARKGGALLGLASFDPRRDYGLSMTERETFARLDTPQKPLDLTTRDKPLDLTAGDNNE